MRTNLGSGLGAALLFFIAIGTASSQPAGRPDLAPTAAERLTIEYRWARVLYEEKRYREAVPLFRELAEEHPASELAIYAANQLLDCLHLLGDRDALRRQVDRFLAMPVLLRDAELRKLLEALKRRLAVPPAAGGR